MSPVIRRTWEYTLLCFALLLALLLCGCRYAMIPLREIRAKDLSQSSVGVVILMPEKKIWFSETFYRVITNEIRETYYSFEGIWDPAPIVQRVCIKALEGKFHTKPVPLWVALEPAEYNKLVSASEAAYNSARMRTGPDAIRGGSSYGVEFYQASPMKYLDAPPIAEVLALRRLDIDYVLELSIHAFLYTRIVGNTAPSVLAYARLIRLSDGLVVWADRGVGVPKKFIRGLESFAELEANNLALIKKHFEEVVMSLFGQEGYIRDFYIFEMLPTD